MTPDQLAELEMHLAAGTDLPTALSAVQRDDQPEPRQEQNPWPAVAVVIVLTALFTAWLLLK